MEKENIQGFEVNIRKSEEGFSVSVPGLPGCWSQGQTKDGAIENIEDAMKSYLVTTEIIGNNDEKS